MIESFLDLYKISLHIIVHNNCEQFITINKEYFLSSDHHLIIHYTPYHALMTLNIGKGHLLPHSVQENNKTRTIFTENPTLNHSFIQTIVNQTGETGHFLLIEYQYDAKKEHFLSYFRII